MESNLHWRYFLALDYDFEQLSRFIEPCEENFESFSLELARIIMAATQECDVVLKELCASTCSENLRTEQKYRDYLNSTISSVQVVCPRYNLKFIPFQAWGNNETPSWWIANNKIKHQRSTHFHQANLKNAMYAISGLLVANLFLLKDDKNKIWLSPEPKNFKPVLEYKSRRTVTESQYIVPS